MAETSSVKAHPLFEVLSCLVPNGPFDLISERRFDECDSGSLEKKYSCTIVTAAVQPHVSATNLIPRELLEAGHDFGMHFLA